MFYIGDYVVCKSHSYESVLYTDRTMLEDSRKYNDNIYIYRVTGSYDGAAGQIITIEGPFNIRGDKISGRRGYYTTDPTLSKYKASNFVSVNDLVDFGVSVVTKNVLTLTAQRSVNAVVFDVENGNLVGKFASDSDAQMAVATLLRKNPSRSYDIFSYTATGSLPELPTVWSNKNDKSDPTVV